MSRRNSKKEIFLSQYPKEEIDDLVRKFADTIGFSFSFFDNRQDAGQDFRDWTNTQILRLIEKLKEYSKQSFTYWLRKRVDSHSSVFAIYNDFPLNGDFKYPDHVPQGVRWGRFRLEGDCRLAGFILPDNLVTAYNLNKNIFYIVFLDENHRFYRT